MTEKKAPDIDRPERNISAPVLGVHLLGLDLQRQVRTRKTIFLFVIQLLPAIIAIFSLVGGSLAGLETFESTVEGVYLPLLLPLAALFFGGPTIVDEVEGRTITYLTLRPLSRTTLLLSKLATSMILAIAVTTIPIVLFFVICMLGSPDGFGAGLPLLGSAVGTVAVGAITYTAVFALLGVIFASTLLPGIVYYVVFELILAAIPLVEVMSIKFHLFTIGGFERHEPDDEGGMREMLENMILDQPLDPQWWVGLLCVGLLTLTAVVASALIFKQRQFHV